MRIIAGYWKGRNLKTVKGLNTRPTADKIKGAIFNILGSKVDGAEVLDLFAGTGNLSFEALSRGAQNAVLVEKDNSAAQTIKKNIELLKAENKAKLWQVDAYTFLTNYNNQNKYDLIFIDPPYYQRLVPKILEYLKKNLILNPNGVIIVETAADEVLPEDIYPLELRIVKEYGSTKIWFIQQVQKTEEG